MHTHTCTETHTFHHTHAHTHTRTHTSPHTLTRAHTQTHTLVRTLHLSYVTRIQEPRLFSMSVADNIAYGCPHQVTRAEIEDAATQSNAYNFCASLPQGFDTIVTDRCVCGGVFVCMIVCVCLCVCVCANLLKGKLSCTA